VKVRVGGGRELEKEKHIVTIREGERSERVRKRECMRRE